MKDFGTSAIPNPMAMLLTQQRDLGLTARRRTASHVEPRLLGVCRFRVDAGVDAVSSGFPRRMTMARPIAIMSRRASGRSTICSRWFLT